jgi:L-2-hydroxycarboxylate dehydrogenase (NAD+)
VRVYSERSWRKLSMQMLEASGTSKQDAKVITDVLVKGSLLGIDSHGVRLLPRLAKKRPKAKMKIVKQASATALLDAGGDLGPVSAKMGMQIAIEKARRHGIGSCSIVNDEWILSLSYYSMMAAEKGMIGMVFAREKPICAPWGGTMPTTGTNPMSIAIPAAKAYPVVLDFATTIVAANHVRTLILDGKPIPEGWLLDSRGNPVKGNLTLDELEARVFKNGGSLLPFGTYKGYAINLVIDILGGALNLSGTGGRGKGQGVLMIAIDVGAFVPRNEFRAEVDRLIADVKSSPLRPGFSEVLLPGEKEYKTMERRIREGIPIDEKSWQNITESCGKLGIEANKVMQ